MNTKTCFKCNEKKALDFFYKHPQTEDGYLGKCKGCAKKDSTKHRKDNIDKIRLHDRERAKLPYRIAQKTKFIKAYNKEFPERYAANITLNHAIKIGKIKRMPCQVCGSTTRIHGHHEDYYKPLEVEWLCSKHHKRKHKEATHGEGLQGTNL